MKSKTDEIKVFLHFLLVDGRIRIPTNNNRSESEAGSRATSISQ
jgi:hypothetical protein